MGLNLVVVNQYGGRVLESGVRVVLEPSEYPLARREQTLRMSCTYLSGRVCGGWGSPPTGLWQAGWDEAHIGPTD